VGEGGRLAGKGGREGRGVRVVLEGGLFLLLKQTLLLLLLLAGWVLCTHVLLYSAEGGREGEREMLCAAALLLHRCFRDFANQATASLASGLALFQGDTVAIKLAHTHSHNQATAQYSPHRDYRTRGTFMERGGGREEGSRFVIAAKQPSSKGKESQ